jgi:hypothetical protein
MVLFGRSAVDVVVVVVVLKFIAVRAPDGARHHLVCSLHSSPPPRAWFMKFGGVDKVSEVIVKILSRTILYY